MVHHYGLDTVKLYMQAVQDNAEESVRRVIDVLKDGVFTYPTDAGYDIQVKITIDKRDRSAHLDFTGTADQQPDNFNAPLAICKAVVLYVFRTLVEDDIPLNAGCLKPLKITVPEGSLLNPAYPAAVVAGNVETSQAIANALYAGSGFCGADAVHTHMTNSRLTDPEILEWRFPVLVEAFHIRSGSGGQGQYRGGNGVHRQIRFLEPMTAAILSGHRTVNPFGLAGGEPGAVGENIVMRNGKMEIVNGCAEVSLATDDVMIIKSPGGGGWGRCPK